MEEILPHSKIFHYLNFNGTGYIPTGWDDHGSVYYRLQDITKEANGIYTALFEGIELRESDFWESYDFASPNMKAIMDAENTKKAPDNLTEAILKIFSSPNYNKTLSIAETLKVKFKLSGNMAAPFIYLTVDRTLCNSSK